MEFLDEDDVRRMHDSILDTGGGTRGIIAAGAIDSALARCKWGPFPQSGTLIERAALLLRGIVQDHPFADGNKRTAYEVTETFLVRNDWFLAASAEEVVTFMLQAAQGAELDHVVAWLAAHAQPLSGGEVKS